VPIFDVSNDGLASSDIIVGLQLDLGASDLFVNMHLGTEMHSFIVANLGNRTTITHDLGLESEHFTVQSASSRTNQTVPRFL
jgi:hypothetical protein